MSPDGARLPQAPRARAPAMALLGTSALVAAGYMDPGNWATAIQSGATAGYGLLWAVVAASLAALAIQWLAARVGAVTGCNLARLCRARLPRLVVFPLWLCAELAIMACDVAETVGAAVALRLLFHIPLWLGVVAAAVLVIVYFWTGGAQQQRLGVVMAWSMLGVLVCVIVELCLAHPHWPQVARGLLPSLTSSEGRDLSWLVVAILGATVMPHNLFLHSDRMRGYLPAGGDHSHRARLRALNVSTCVCLGFATLINIGLMLLAAAAFGGKPHEVGDLAKAQAALAPALGSAWPGVVFAMALLCCGINSMVSGTLAGQAVMEGFLDIRLSAATRSIVTRALALGPALVVVDVWGGTRSTWLLVVSQIVLSVTLPLAIVPLVVFASRRELMGKYRLKPALSLLFGGLAVAMIAVTVAGVLQVMRGA